MQSDSQPIQARTPMTRGEPKAPRRPVVSRILVYTMARAKTDSTVLTIRVPAALDRHLTREARRRRQTRSEVARAILQERFAETDETDLATEARRQSLLVRRRRSERDALAFAVGTADLRGWR